LTGREVYAQRRAGQSPGALGALCHYELSFAGWMNMEIAPVLQRSVHLKQPSQMMT